MLGSQGGLNRVGAAVSNALPRAGATLNLDFTLGTLDSRITFTRASSATFFDSAGVLQTAASDAARFTYDPATLQPQGLLIEEQRTNSIRNNTMVGAVAGTPGTAPTNWNAATGGSGITRELVGTGTENGITYIDFRFSGTGASTAFQVINTDTTTGIAAATGQAWSGSFYLKLVAGSTTGTDIKMQLLEIASGSGVVQNLSAALSPTSQNLATQRVIYSATLSGGATITNLQQGLRLVFTNGVAVDITLRIGLPQLEQGAFATSVIPTTTTALTRNADVASMTGTNFSSWYSASEGTFVANFLCGNLSADGVVLEAGDGGLNNRMNIEAQPTTSLRAWPRMAASGSLQIDIPINNVLSLTTATRAALAYAANNTNFAANGTVGTTDTSCFVPTVDRMGIGRVNTSGAFLNGTIRRIAYYPVRLSNQQLQALTG
jgi:hypothetical protein